MRLYVHMLLCGSICTLLYLLFNHALPHELSLKGRRIFLRVNTALYLLPLPWFAAQVKVFLKRLLESGGMVFRESGRFNVMDTASIWDSLVIVDEEGKLLYITGYQDCLPLVGGMLAVFLLLLLGWMALYLRTCRGYKKTAVYPERLPECKEKSAEGALWNKTFSGNVPQAKAGRRNVQIGFSSAVSTPLAIGFFHPLILLPEAAETDAAFSPGGKYENVTRSIVRHELKHISGWDMVWRFFAFAAVAVAWFHPLVWYLLKEEIAVSEMLCDEAAVGDGTKREKAEYIRCVMEAVQKQNGWEAAGAARKQGGRGMAGAVRKQGGRGMAGAVRKQDVREIAEAVWKKISRGVTAASLASSGSLLEERIKRIIGKNRKKRWKSSLAALIMAACFLCSSFPALAYRLPGKYTVTEESFGMDEGWDSVDMVVFIPWEDMEEDYEAFRNRELMFRCDNGRICCMDSFLMEKDNREAESCRHDYQPGIVAQHIRTSGKGCTVATWEAEGCAGCGEVTWTGKRLATAGSVICCHGS